ncbi:hypothetical protein C7H19_11280 [Aphanothece hegewaldii CCALA 016]|uniref:Peptidase M28 domain-containing protein n=1 Tax=Aphanothece hegewaldii CCALA 016 TaxID=2107694 RepID=A0A2T1LY30_9CHRO|nr:PEP-CTERM sorting domain-containing protein [Aphanothece hegewaldii]PSF37292.1 hypothetical protein C7H19_11280 [Aphanothece hegewaldii CCALA 016]
MSITINPLKWALLTVTVPFIFTPTEVLAGTFGNYGVRATEILTELSLNHAGRSSGSAKEQVTADYLQGLFQGYGYSVNQQPFDTTDRQGNQISSQNVVAVKPGTSGKQIIIGAHYDTAPSSATIDRSALQGTNDNSSSVGLIVELAERFSMIPTQHTLTFLAFGAEEVGLKGSSYYANNMSSNEIENTIAMLNFDSIVFGDYMYFHAGLNAADDPALGWVRDQALDIAADLGIDARTNPGLNEEYPAGTGCCSDQESFETLVPSIPILVAEATNWEIGDLDGYTQTSNPIVPGGATWHNPQYDNLTFINTYFPGLIEERTSNYSQIVTTLLSDLTSVPEPSSILGLGVAVGVASLMIRQKRL